MIDILTVLLGCWSQRRVQSRFVVYLDQPIGRQPELVAIARVTFIGFKPG
jgi:hypothetical protein